MVKDMKIECEPSVKEVKFKLEHLFSDITDTLKNIACPTKSYLVSFRHSGVLMIEHEPFSFQS